MSFASWFFLIAVVIILAVDGVLYFNDRQTITQWHMEKVKNIPWVGRIILLAWGALIGHLFLTLALCFFNVSIWKYGEILADINFLTKSATWEGLETPAGNTERGSSNLENTAEAT